MLLSLAIILFGTGIAEEREDSPRLPPSFFKGVSKYTWAGNEHVCVRREKGTVEVLTIPAGKVDKLLEFADFQITAIATSARGRFLFVAGEEKKSAIGYVIDLQTYRQVARIPLRERCFIIAGATDAKGFVLGLVDGSLMSISEEWKPFHDMMKLCTNPEERIMAIAMSSKAEFCAASVTGKRAQGEPLAAVYDLKTGKECWSHIGLYTASAVAFVQPKKMNEQQYFFFADEKSRVHKLDVQRRGEDTAVKPLASTQYGTLVDGLGFPAVEGAICIATSGKLSIESAGETSVIAKWKPSSTYVSRLSMSPSGRYVGFVMVDKTEGSYLAIYDRDKRMFLTTP